jgi:FkbM family methyltransferase
MQKLNSLIRRVVHALFTFQINFMLRYFGNAEYILNRIIRLDWARRPRLSPEALLPDEKITLFDIGARGGVSPWFKPYEKNLAVYYVEPDIDADLGMGSAVEVLDVVRRGISNRNGTALLKITKAAGGSSLYHPTGAWRDFYARNLNDWEVEKTAEIQVTTISQVLGNSQIDILKIDVQGAEFDVIDGMEHVRPYLIYCEVSGVELYKDQKTVFEVASKLRSMGYIMVNNRMYWSSTPSTTYYRSTIQTHGDCVFVPDFNTGKTIINRNQRRFVQCLCIAGLSDIVNYYVDHGALVASRDIREILNKTNYVFDPY